MGANRKCTSLRRVGVEVKYQRELKIEKRMGKEVERRGKEWYLKSEEFNSSRLKEKEK